MIFTLMRKTDLTRDSDPTELKRAGGQGCVKWGNCIRILAAYKMGIEEAKRNEGTAEHRKTFTTRVVKRRVKTSGPFRQKKPSQPKEARLKCFHNGIILIVIRFQIYATKV